MRNLPVFHVRKRHISWCFHFLDANAAQKNDALSVMIGSAVPWDHLGRVFYPSSECQAIPSGRRSQRNHRSDSVRKPDFDVSVPCGMPAVAALRDDLKSKKILGPAHVNTATARGKLHFLRKGLESNGRLLCSVFFRPFS